MVLAAAQGLTLEVSCDAMGQVYGGDTIRYTIVVVNSDAAPYSGVSLSGSVPDGTVYVPGSVQVQVAPLAATSVVFNTSGPFVAPAGVTSVIVEAWGGGGGGGKADTGGNNAGGGGGGGGYARSVVAVTPGAGYAVEVGVGGAAAVAGGDSWFGSGDAVYASGGGAGGIGQTVGAGGIANLGNQAVFTGGTGGSGRTTANNRRGGGGAGSAYSTAAGGDGQDGASDSGGAGGMGEGAGGAGTQGTDNGNAGLTPGGGGGGGGAAAVGGPGADGRVIVTYDLLGSTGVPPDLASGWVLRPGAVLTATFEVLINDPPGVAEIVSTATLTANQLAEPLSTTLTVPAFNATAPARYLVIDLSAGPTATSYPVTSLDAVPEGGWTDEYKTTKLVLRRIPAGVFTMGAPADELGRRGDEALHPVSLTQGYYLGVFEVTQRQWERVMGDWPSYFRHPGYSETRPVEQVGYDAIRGDDTGAGWPAHDALDADSFMGRLRQRAELAFDLPTEAQWEHAARAGSSAALHSGENLDGLEICSHLAELGRYWHNGSDGFTPLSDASAGTATVGSYAPNAWGLYDMHGNVWEWCRDRYGSYPASSTDPMGAVDGDKRVTRGGSWDLFADLCRSAVRHANLPRFNYYYYGFRVFVPVSVE